MSEHHTESMTQAQQVYAHLKDALYRCKYQPGQEISEKQLYEELSFGRTPIRETLLQLQKEGLVEIYPRKGMRIAPITHQQIDELYQIRKLIEPSIAVSHCSKYSKLQLLEYQRLLANSASMSDDEFYALDIEFHIFLISISENHMLIDFFSTLMWHMHRMAIYAAIRNCSKRQNNDPEHIRIINALLDEDPVEIRNALVRHINSSMIASLKLLNPPQ